MLWEFSPWDPWGWVGLEILWRRSTLAVRVRVPQRGWEKHAKHSKWSLPSTELGTCKWTETSLLVVGDLGLQITSA